MDNVHGGRGSHEGKDGKMKRTTIRCLTRRCLAGILTAGLLLSGCPPMVAAAEDNKAADADLETKVNETLSQLTLGNRARLQLGGNTADPGQGTVIGNQTTGLMADKGIPYMNMSDGPLGVNANGSGTSFGSGQIIASTWNRELTEKAGEVLGKEALAKDVQYFLAPGTNINRDLINGRTFEYYSEDPYLSANVVAPYVKGVQSQDVLVTVKHFLANNQEKNRNFMSSNVSERALHEVYLPAFKAAVEEADAWGVMTAANRSNGVFASDNRYLLTNLLKYDYGLKGIVMTDWINVRTGVISAKAGLDLAMPYSSGSPFTKLEMYVKTRQLDEKYVNEAAQRIVRTAYLTKSMVSTDKADAAGYTREDRKQGELNTAANQAIARQVAEEGQVLLKNENSVLPLDKNELNSLALIGKYVDYDFYTVGTGGSGWTNPPYQVTFLEGMQNKLGKDVELVTPKYDENNLDQTVADAVEAAKNADYAIIYAGLNSTSTSDPNVADTEDGDRGNLDFPPAQLALIKAVAAAKPGKTIVVLSGSIYEVRDWVDDVPAVLQTFYSGMEGGNATADILLGNLNPSGKLTNTWPKRYEDTAGYVPGNDAVDQRELKKDDVTYSEGLYVGYKYNDKYNIEPEFAFGHGLSYSDFTYSNLRFSSDRMGRDDTITVSVDVTNNGDMDGKETVQLYIHDAESSVERPVKELKGFEKLDIPAGETRTASFAVTTEELSFWDVNTHSFMAEKGAFEAWVGGTSEEARLQKGTFYLTEDTLPDPDYTVVQAEDFEEKTNVTDGTNQEVDGENTSFVDFADESSQIAQNISVDEEGEYSVIFRYSNDGYSGDTTKSYGPNKATKLIVNGEDQGSYDFQNTRHDNVWNYDSIDVNLKQGENEIILQATQETKDLRVDKMIIQKINRIFPKPSACAQDDGGSVSPEPTEDGVAFQIENYLGKSGDSTYVGKSDDVIIEMEVPGYSGEGYIHLKPNSYVEFEIKAVTTVSHRLSLYYSNGTDTAAPCDVYVNDKLAGSFELCPTGGWSKWKFEQTQNNIPVYSGTNVVKLVAKDQEVYVDKMVLCGGMGNPDNTAPAINGTAPADNGTLSDISGGILVHFSEDVEEGKAFDRITVTDGTETVACAAELAGKTLTLQPEASLAYGKTYVVHIPQGAVRDFGMNTETQSANELAQDHTFTFRTPEASLMDEKSFDYEGFRYHGTWGEGTGCKETMQAGSTAEFYFKGTSAKLLALSGSGEIKIYVDDQEAETVSVNGEGVIYNTKEMADGIHYVKLELVSGSIGFAGAQADGRMILLPLDKTEWTVSAYSDLYPGMHPFRYAIDNNINTKWTSGAPQSDGGEHWFKIDFGQAIDFNSIFLYSSGSDYFVGYEIYVSDDGADWGSRITSGYGKSAYNTITFADQHARYLKIVQTGGKSSWWAVNEVDAFCMPSQGEQEDNEKPEAPEYVVSRSYKNEIALRWDGARDNAGIKEYHVYRDGEKIAETAEKYFIDAHIESGKEYEYYVVTVDLSGNESDASEHIFAQNDEESDTYPKNDWTSSNFNGSGSTALMFDENVYSRWTSQAVIANGQWFTVDMKRKRIFNMVTIDTNTTDFASKYIVSISDDGENWSEPIMKINGQKNHMQGVVIHPVEARYIKVTVEGSSSRWLSIYEFGVKNALLEDQENPTVPDKVSAEGFRSFVQLFWAEATDDLGVEGYIVYRDGKEIARTSETNYADYAVKNGKTHSYCIEAYDYSGKTSGVSAAVQAAADESKAALPRNRWKFTAYNEISTDPCVSALDGNAASRWTSGLMQAPGDWFQIDMGAEYCFNRVIFNSGNDYPAGYELYVSADGKNWTEEPVAKGAGNGDVTDIKTARQKARYIRLVQTGSRSSWLSVHEINVWNETDKTSLEKMISMAEGLDASEYTKESWVKIADALAAARQVQADAAASQEEIDAAVNCLIQALGELEYGVQKLHLETAIKAAGEILILAGNYKENAQSLKDAMEAGRAVLENQTATQEETDKAACAILDELAKLAKKADIASLESLINAAKGLLDGKYTAESLERLGDAVTKAEEVLQDPDRNDHAVSDAYAELIDAMVNLVMKGSKAALKAMIVKAELVLTDADAYVASTIDGLAAVLADAKTVYEDGNAVQEEIDQAVKTLTDRVAGARLIGDVNGDGRVDTADGTALLRYAAELETLGTAAKSSADINGDGMADTEDVVLILQYASEKILAF